VITQVYGKRGASALHRYDPRGKTLLLLTFLVLFFLPIRVVHLGAYLAVLVVLSVTFLGLPNTLRPIRMILPILILVLLLTPPFYREGPVLISVKGVVILSLPGLLEAIRLIVRFTGITLIFYIFIGTTDPDTLILSFRWFGLPFMVSLILGIALEYIPTILTLYSQVQDAHRLRRAGKGIGGERRGLFKRLREAVPVLTSVLVLSVRRIPTLAMALESRGVGRKNRRSSYHTLKVGPSVLRDWAVAVLVLGALAVSVLLFP
jgi:energy-coupling factor transport system permease protein